jgi:hypothetical protein
LFYRENEKMVEFAHAVQQKLNQYKADDATMGEVNHLYKINVSISLKSLAFVL